MIRCPQREVSADRSCCKRQVPLYSETSNKGTPYHLNKWSCKLSLSTHQVDINSTVKPVFKGHSDERTPSDQGTFSQNRVLSSPVKEPVTKGHLPCMDNFSWILRCPFQTGFTVHWITMYAFSNIHRVTMYLVAFLSGNKVLLNIENYVQSFRIFIMWSRWSPSSECWPLIMYKHMHF